MNILVINTGSSSLKFTCLDMEADLALARGQVERIGLAGTTLIYKDHKGAGEKTPVEVRDHTGAVACIVKRLTDPEAGVLSSPEEIRAVGHRLVHAGEKINRTVLVTQEVKQIMTECFHLAPLHNPPNLEGVAACEAYFGNVPQVGVFDTAFHGTLPPKAYLYGLPYGLYETDGIRRYGFHGTSHAYVSRRAAAILGRDPESLKIVSCHLGNGSSIAAVDGGRSVDTSMGMTPLEGLIMGTRCGDLDPGVIMYLLEQRGMSPAGVNALLNKESGLLGLAGAGSADLRDIEAKAAAGDAQARQALEAFCYRVTKYIGAYAAAMGGLDVVLFTAGIGENSTLVREMACASLGFLGLDLDLERNEALNRGEGLISAPGSRVSVLIVKTDEEREIARQTLELLQKIDDFVVTQEMELDS